MESSNKVVLNSIYLYLNMAAAVVIQLVSVRILVNAFGVTDYGIFSLVGGIVAMFAFINVAMAASTQRFLSYAIGQGEEEKLREVFYQSVLLHTAIAIILGVALEAGGVYYIRHIMEAPQERIDSATMLLHCITASTIVNILTVPYEADINANEDMGILALISILDSLLKLCTAILVAFSKNDKLQLYGLLTMSCLILTLLIKRVYCLRRYPESHFRWHRVQDFSQIRSIMSFTAWNLIGSGGSVVRYQGTGIVINKFFQITMNTAYGIAQQVNALLLFFANSIVRAIRPQIVKSEGMGDRNRMLRLAGSTCKITSLMVALIGIPLCVSIQPVLTLWLGHAPSEANMLFCRYFLLIVFLNQLTIGLQVAFESVGRIREIQLFVGTLHVAPVLLGYVSFRLGQPIERIMQWIVVEECVALLLRIMLAQRIMQLPAWAFAKENILPTVTVVGMIATLTWWASGILNVQGFFLPLFTTSLSVPLLALTSYTILFNDTERQVIQKFALMVFRRLR